jgi:hypothetical protein
VLKGNVHVPYGNEPLALAAVAENRAQIVFGDRNAALSDRKVESRLSVTNAASRARVLVGQIASLFSKTLAG